MRTPLVQATPRVKDPALRLRPHEDPEKLRKTSECRTGASAESSPCGLRAQGATVHLKLRSGGAVDKDSMWGLWAGMKALETQAQSPLWGGVG